MKYLVIAWHQNPTYRVDKIFNNYIAAEKFANKICELDLGLNVNIIYKPSWI